MFKWYREQWSLVCCTHSWKMSWWLLKYIQWFYYYKSRNNQRFHADSTEQWCLVCDKHSWKMSQRLLKRSNGFTLSDVWFYPVVSLLLRWNTISNGGLLLAVSSCPTTSRQEKTAKTCSLSMTRLDTILCKILNVSVFCRSAAPTLYRGDWAAVPRLSTRQFITE